MMTNGHADLFPQSLPDGHALPPAPGVTDTSKEAADRIVIRVGSLRHTVLMAIVDAGAFGATGSELTNELGEWTYSIKPRCTELKKLAFIEDSGFRRPNDLQRREIVWRITDKGNQYAQRYRYQEVT